MKLVTAILLCAGLLSGVLAGQALEASRSAAADLDHDGELEVITGGRLGPFLSGSGQGGAIQITDLKGGRVEIVTCVTGMTVIRDVAIGNHIVYGGFRVFSVGDGWLRAHRYESGSLLEVTALQLASDWTDRIAVLNRNTTSLIVVTEYVIRPDSDVGETVVRAFEARAETLQEIWYLTISAHVGDLAFLGEDDRSHLIVETGTGEEGGDILVFEISGGSRPILTWSKRMTQGNRCLSIEVTNPSRGEVLLRSINGDAAIYVLGRQGLELKRRLSISAGVEVVPVFGIASTSSGAFSPTRPSQVLFRKNSGTPYRLTTF